MGLDQSKDNHKADFAKLANVHLTQLSANLNNLRKESILCDVSIVCRGYEFEAHKAVLAAASPYFLSFFRNEPADGGKVQVQLDDANPEGLEAVLEYIYTGHARISSSNVEPILQVALLLKVEVLYEQCCVQLAFQINIDSFVSIWNIADRLKDSSLRANVIGFCVANFTSIISRMDFLELSRERVQRLLSDDRLRVTRDRLLETVVEWVKHDPAPRAEDASLLLGVVGIIGISDSMVDKVKNCESLLIEVPALRRYLHMLIASRTPTEPDLKDLSTLNREPLIMAMGENDKGAPVLLCYDPHEKTWTQTQASPFNVRLTGLTASRGKLYCAGGKKRDVYQCSLHALNMADLEVTELAVMSVPRALLSLVKAKKHLYAIGGFNTNGYLATVEKYSIKDNTWSMATPLQEARSGIGVAYFNGQIYAVGGRNEQAVMTTVECYDLESEQWTRLTPLLYPRSHCGLAVLGGVLHVVGGSWSVLDLKKAMVGCIQCYDNMRDSWTALDHNIPTMSMVTAVVPYKNALFILTSSGRIFSFKPSADKLKELRRSPCNKGFIRAAFLIERR